MASSSILPVLSHRQLRCPEETQGFPSSIQSSSAWLYFPRFLLDGHQLAGVLGGRILHVCWWASAIACPPPFPLLLITEYTLFLRDPPSPNPKRCGVSRADLVLTQLLGRLFPRVLGQETQACPITIFDASCHRT